MTRLRLTAALAAVTFASPLAFAQPVLPVPVQAGPVADQAVVGPALSNAVHASARLSGAGGTFGEVGIVQAGSSNDRFGFDVALSGSNIVVGIPGKGSGNVGEVRFYALAADGTSITGGSPLVAVAQSDTDAEFGYSVDIDGNRAVIGAPGAGTDGAAFVYERLLSGAWGLVATLVASDAMAGDRFGAAVALDGGRIVVGAPDANGALTGSGAVYAFAYDGSAWQQEFKLTDESAGGQFGAAVDLDDGRAVIGAPFYVVSGVVTGAAVVADRQNNGTWTGTRIGAASAAADDEFGAAVALDGDLVLVGSSRDDDGGTNSGSAFLFERQGSSYTEIQTLAASDAETGDRFGISVDLREGRAVIGAHFADTPGSTGSTGQNRGYAYVFDESGGVWTESQIISTPLNVVSSQDNLGRSVSLDRGRVLLGAPGRSRILGTNGNSTTSQSLVGAAVLFESSIPSVELTGPEGWRIVAAPGDSETVESFLGPIWTQGFAGADYNGTSPVATPNVYQYFEIADGDLNVGYGAVTSASSTIAPGTGLFVYVFADDDLDGISDPFPKRLLLSGDEPTLPFSFITSYVDNFDGGPDVGDDVLDDGWNLLGNPFRSALDWDDLYGTGVGTQSDNDVATNIDPTAYVYDPSAGYLVYNATTNTGTLAGGLIPVGSGFFVRANASGATLTKGNGGGGNGGGANRMADSVAPHVMMRVTSSDATGREVSGSAVIALVSGALAGHDRDDAPLFAPLGDAYVSLGATDGRAGDLPLLHAALPGPSELAASTTVDLALGISGVATDATVSWDLALPDGWTARLLDRTTGTETPMTDGATLAVDLGGLGIDAETGRFAVLLASGNATDDEDAPAAAEVSLVHPNPTASRAALAVSVPGSERVRVVVYDALGREVAVALDGVVSGDARVGLDVSALPAGAYVVRVVGESFRQARRLTVVR